MTDPAAKPPRKQKANAYPWYSPRIWHGMRFRPWMRLLARHHFALHPLRIGMAVLVTPFTVFNSLAYRLQLALHGEKIAAATPHTPMVFIVGHWRSGTTFLHELMSLDEAYTSPSTIQCFGPCQFLLIGDFVSRWFNFIMPSTRPMDNMKVGWSKPQEDEFALLALGAPSPYYRMAFPDHPAEGTEFLDMEGIDEADLAKWRETLDQFVRMITVQRDKPIILKSPTHTGRIGLLSEMYPDAKFIHIARNPLEVFASTERLWQTMDEIQSFQHPKNPQYRQYIFDCFDRMYGGYFRDVDKLGPDRLVETRYEDIVADPVGELEKIYAALGLGDFEQVRPQMEAATAESRSFQRNKHQMEDDLAAEIYRRWSQYFERYGYAADGTLVEEKPKAE
ncbi:sulfotransferase family protein [Blastopirellula marina]|uniref:Sulfotransferase n=1 Tax=Blastopirellula marina DSM 3645 TaxID=314230 RepID=A3ZZN7_9BACT|nr:sulfotransferase [Blastopirellula marina]EAQ77988.1 hypothetical protein DSM3645_16110 [Blastopirellula marina DSM 3645]